MMIAPEHTHLQQPSNLDLNTTDAVHSPLPYWLWHERTPRSAAARHAPQPAAESRCSAALRPNWPRERPRQRPAAPRGRDDRRDACRHAHRHRCWRASLRARGAWHRAGLRHRRSRCHCCHCRGCQRERRAATGRGVDACSYQSDYLTVQKRSHLELRRCARARAPWPQRALIFAASAASARV